MKKPENDEEGLKLWRGVTRSVRAYVAGKKPAKEPPKPEKKPKKEPQPRIEPPPPPPSGQGFDRATRTKLERGKLPLEGCLDLHGMTQQEAFTALHNFIPAAAARDKRTVLVITGKGRLHGGVLRRMLPLWLEAPDLARYILAVTPAQPKDGGEGAFYIRLRKKK